MVFVSDKQRKKVMALLKGGTKSAVAPELVGRMKLDKPIAVGISKKNVPLIKADLRRSGFRGLTTKKTNNFFTIFFKKRIKK